MKEINWSELGFEYTDTNSVVRCSYKDGKWGELRATNDKYISLHVSATSLQYGQEAFEGLKAFRGVDGKVRIFRMEENARRLQASCRALYMAELPTELFCDAIRLALRENIDYLPPYETGATLYFRPLLIGTSAKLGVGPGKEYEFIIITSPIGPYFKLLAKPQDGHSAHTEAMTTQTFIINRHVDRAAPLGTGPYKVGGNYACSFRATEPAHNAGMGCMFLDAKHHRYIDECGAANFFGIKTVTNSKGEVETQYVTPRSASILPSITNNSLMTLARDMGIKVIRRHIAVDELSEMSECGACGTACVIAPINKVIDADKNKVYMFGEKPGPVSKRLYQALQDIQYGRTTDPYGWCEVLQV